MDGFFRRTYVTTTVVAAVVALWMWAAGHAHGALAFLGGVAVGILTLSALVLVVNAVVCSPQERVGPRWPYFTLHVGKFLLIAGVFFALSRWAMDSMAYVAAGYGLPIAVAVLKTLGSALNRRLGVDRGESL